VEPLFTGYDVDGGYAEYMTPPEDFIYPMPTGVSSREFAPFLCAGIIGYRAPPRRNLQKGETLGLYGFGASAHIVIVIQLAPHWGCNVYVCTREERYHEMARQMGATWVGSEAATPPVKLNSGILFAPAGELVPVALAALNRGGTLALAGIHMTPIPPMDNQQYLFLEPTCGASPPIAGTMVVPSWNLRRLSHYIPRPRSSPWPRPTLPFRC